MKFTANLLCAFAFLCSLLFATKGLNAQTGALAAPSPQESGKPKRIPTRDLAAFNPLSMPVLSPTGRYLATRLFANGKTYIFIHDFKLDGSKPKRLELPEKSEINWMRWTSDKRLIAGIALQGKLDGEDIVYTRAVIIDHGAGTTQYLGKANGDYNGDSVIFFSKDGTYVLLSYSRSWTHKT